jgi:hypothetical protein
MGTTKQLKLEDVESVVRRVFDERRDSPWLKTEEAAAYLGSTIGTLKTWRIRGCGPRHHGGHRFTRYHKDDLDAFLRGEANR